MRKTIIIRLMSGMSASTLVFAMFSLGYAQDENSTEILEAKHHDCGVREERGTISVTGEGKDFFAPDTAVITLGVETTESAADEAVSANSRKAEEVTKTIKQMINPDKGDSIRTSAFAVQPVYEYDSARKKNLLTGYRARHQITVRTAKTAGAGAIIDAAVRNGANEVSGVAFILAGAKNYCEGVLRKAVDNARKEATFVAGTLDARITGIKSISPACGTEMPRPVFRQAVMAQAAPAETSLEVGEVAVNASVAVVFYIGAE